EHGPTPRPPTQDEAGETAGRNQEAPQSPAEAVIRPFDDGVGERREADGGEGGSGKVEPTDANLLALGAAAAQGEENGERRERQVEEEDPAPGERLHDG